MPDEHQPTGHMSPEEFRRQGHAAIDWIADYWASLDDLPVRAQVAPGDVRRQLPASAPEHGEPFDALLADLDRVVVPGLTHWQHPRFFAYFPANSSPAAILGDLLSSGIGAQGMIWATSPAVTEVEQVVLDWFAEALGLPEAFRSDGAGRRRHPGHRVDGDVHRAARRAAPRQRGRGAGARRGRRAVAGLRLDAGALVAGEGGHDGRAGRGRGAHRSTSTPRRRRSTSTRCATRSPRTSRRDCGR